MSQAQALLLRHRGLASTGPSSTDMSCLCPKGDSLVSEPQVSEAKVSLLH